MSSRREKLIASVLSNAEHDQSAKSLETVLRLILGDMGQFYNEFHQADGPGVMVFQPNSKEASMFYMPVAALHEWREDQPEAAQDIQKIIEACIKIDPTAQAGYLIVDDDGFRFSIIDYNKTADSESVVES